MPSDKPILRLEDMLENIARIKRYTRNYNFERFAQDQQCQDAVERCLLRISEAAGKIEAVVEAIAPDQPWSDIRAVGNVLRHEYDQIDALIIRQIVTDDLGSLGGAVERALAILREDKA